MLRISDEQRREFGEKLKRNLKENPPYFTAKQVAKIWRGFGWLCLLGFAAFCIEEWFGLKNAFFFVVALIVAGYEWAVGSKALWWMLVASVVAWILHGIEKRFDRIDETLARIEWEVSGRRKQDQ